jgi:hydroxybutyrate-dimer hydrolase
LSHAGSDHEGNVVNKSSNGDLSYSLPRRGFAFILRRSQTRGASIGRPERALRGRFFHSHFPWRISLVSIISQHMRPLVGFAIVAVIGPAWAVQDLNAGMANTRNAKPAFIGEITAHYYGATAPASPPNPAVQDLLTAGLGKSGLGTALVFANPTQPTALELRQRAIHTNYRALLDPTAAGGYGTLYGPNVDSHGTVTASEGLVPGWEYLSYADDGSGRKNVTVMVQVPDTFDPAHACIVTATSSGSRGIYGAIGTSGEWGLKHGCAVAYTDKGSGNGLHDLMTDAVGAIDGTRTTADAAGEASHFTAALSNAERSAFNTAFPNRVAFKHAHSEQNSEKDWGLNTLQAVVFSFYVLNEHHANAASHPQGGKRVALDRKNTLVIASSVSNGGGAAVLAAEQDQHGLIDGLAVTEPQMQPDDMSGLAIVQGTTPMQTIGAPLYDYFTFGNLYQPCAALSAQAAGAPALAFLSAASAANRCSGLAAKGLLPASATTLAQRADASLAKLHEHGWLPDSDVLHASHYRFATNAIVMTYANAYGRFSVADNVCSFSFANTDATGNVIPQVLASQANIFATGNGVPPTTGVNIVYNDSAGGAKLDLSAISPSTSSADFALDGAICHRNLAEGRDIVTGAPLSGAQKEASDRVRAGIAEVQATGRLKNLPAIIVQGRADTLVPVNHASRAYYAKNQSVASGASNTRYIEVTNAQHFDAFLPGGAVFGGYEKRFVPLHVYFIRAMDAMYAHLTSGAPLPASQVVRATPRCSAPFTCPVAPDITAANVPPIAANPAAADRITFDKGTLHVPD